MKLKVLSIALGLGLITLASCNQKRNKNVALNNELDSVSYSLGASFGTNLERNGLTNLNEEVLLAALYASLDKDSLVIDPQKGNAVINNYIKGLQEKIGAENLAKGQKFLEENKSKEGIVVTASGLQYRIINEGDGPKPLATDKVSVHYKGTTIDGKEFDSSYKRNEPATFAANRVIKGWTEALQLMPVGSKWELFIPSNLAYGPRAMGADIKANETLIFEVELLDIIKDDKKN
ncbi:FKBP-type peptidyl-prolyl cis-trans isomerase [Labilibaculum sp. A4]|uniref:FKBP-type peptidyl-prolyl cis-trans isomerase n=1 Tax=Labilibaculum euxinus TaxID=2686357 RepID=UPI000F61DFC3|nr:FKBP-type peptidyl-prolyl cis-trans isomerase [Labilibaculum euxinus]MDQ1771276.1 FKBP-type peptidyl-prolyl cis-trans isomerase [Labilibaculum euxinus]MWN77063.1 FKBP-type peptidyl-prolyl cis-trans isomerase [Labilibaculum euxinus]